VWRATPISRVCYSGGEMEEHRIVGPAYGEPRPAGQVGARVRVPLSGTPSPRWAEALRTHLAAALAGHSHVGHVRLNRLVQGATVVIEGVEPEEAEQLGPALRRAVADANRTAGPHPDAASGGPNMPQERADEIAARVRLES
jgi:hypothetical protein